MHIKENLLNFLYDKDFFINIYDNNIYIFNYNVIDLLTSNKIIIRIDNKKITIEGNNLLVSKMTKSEILIKGIITNIVLIYE